MFNINNTNLNILPKVSIGVPVYNGANSLRATIDSIINQTFKDFELIISDNNSEDNTKDICMEYVKRDSRIRYILQNKNIGALKNFQYVFGKSRGEYFMWVGADDILAPLFIENNYIFLLNNPDYVASISKTKYGSEINQNIVGSFEINDEINDERIKKYIIYPAANSRFYSLFKRNALNSILSYKYNYLASDWSIMIDVLNNGKMKCLNAEYELFRSNNGASVNVINLFNSLRRSKIEYILPLYYFSIKLLTQTKISRFIIINIFKLNIKFLKYYIIALIIKYIKR